FGTHGRSRRRAASRPAFPSEFTSRTRRWPPSKRRDADTPGEENPAGRVIHGTLAVERLVSHRATPVGVTRQRVVGLSGGERFPDLAPESTASPGSHAANASFTRLRSPRRRRALGERLPLRLQKPGVASLSGRERFLHAAPEAGARPIPFGGRAPLVHRHSPEP